MSSQSGPPSAMGPARPRPRHLMDPDNPVRISPNSRSISTVQTWVMSVLAVTTILHLTFGLILAAFFLEESNTGGRVGLAVIGGAFAVVAVAAGRGIHRKALVSPWLLLGLLPTVVAVPFLV